MEIIKNKRFLFHSFLVVVCLHFFACQKNVNTTNIASSEQKNQPWYYMDYELDSVPGIGLSRVYDEFIKNDIGQNVIVAVIDATVDIDHEDLRNQLFVNSDEIPSNRVDDDSNGYVDDIHGWNFIGYDGHKSLDYALYDHTRFVKKYFNKFNTKNESDIHPDDLYQFKKYQKAIQLRTEQIEMSGLILDAAQQYREIYFKAIEVFSDRLPGYDDTELENLNTVVTRNAEEEELLGSLKSFRGYGLDLDYLDLQEKQAIADKFTCTNLKYDDRVKIGDDPYDLISVGYGSNNVHGKEDVVHGTWVTGVIAGERNNIVGMQGISDRIKLMLLPIFPVHGDYSDKDFYNAVRYAVDNGAKIINFSGGKHFTENEELIFDALKYAEANDVLFVTSAGNKGIDIDKPENEYYPTDRGANGTTISNVISVGSSTKELNGKILAEFSNYGKETVDFFAPGDEVFTTTSLPEKYNSNGYGTSISTAMTSGVAALLLSYFPELSIYETKKILMDSGTKIDLKVKPTDLDSIPFNELSKSGKILNAYNAFKLAKSMKSD